MLHLQIISTTEAVLNALTQLRLKPARSYVSSPSKTLGPFVKVICLALFLILTGLAEANTWELSNRTGGKLVATDRPCPMEGGKGLLYIYSYISSGEVLRGCWTTMDRTVVVMWENGKMTVHALEAFTDGITGQPYQEPVDAVIRERGRAVAL